MTFFCCRHFHHLLFFLLVQYWWDGSIFYDTSDVRIRRVGFELMSSARLCLRGLLIHYLLWLAEKTLYPHVGYNR